MRYEHDCLIPLLLYDALKALDSASTDLTMASIVAEDPTQATDWLVLADAIEAEAAALRATIARRN